jgi:macrolide transport system ATP-binding/permease protein
VILLVGAGLLGKSLYRLLQVNLGIKSDHLATLEVLAPNIPYQFDGRLATNLARNALRETARIPGVQSAALATLLPVGAQAETTWLRVIGHPWNGEHNETPYRNVSAAYFSTLGARLLRGRYFREDEDNSKPRVAIINETFAKVYFADEDPIGKQLTRISGPIVPFEIVGVVQDIREGQPDTANQPVLYTVYEQGPGNYFVLVARTSQNAEGVISAMAEIIRTIDPRITTRNGMTMDEKIDRGFATYVRRSSALVVGGFASLALLLSVVGLYGVIAYSVSQRTREIGVRIALGAQATGVYRLILGEALWLVAAGICAGLVSAVVAARFMRSVLFETQVWDAWTLFGVAMLLAIAALAASYVPARRAAAVDPVEALRAE